MYIGVIEWRGEYEVTLDEYEYENEYNNYLEAV